MIVEDGSELVADLWALRYQAASSVLSYPEGRVALAAARRGRRLSADGHSQARQEFESLQSELLLVGIDRTLAHQAGELAEAFALLGYDAVHLASALAVDGATTLISSDQDLRRAATQSGCATAPAD